MRQWRGGERKGKVQQRGGEEEGKKRGGGKQDLFWFLVPFTAD